MVTVIAKLLGFNNTIYAHVHFTSSASIFICFEGLNSIQPSSADAAVSIGHVKGQAGRSDQGKGTFLDLPQN